MNDPILTQLLEAKDAHARQRALEVILLEHVQPVIARVLGQYRAPGFAKEDADDLAATVNLRIVRRLQHLGAGDPILRLDDYVATVAYNVVYGFLRRRYPERTRLKNRLRYLFTRDDHFALWERDGDFVCGLAGWRGRGAAMLDRRSPSAALAAVFERENAPLRLDDVVRIAAELWHDGDTPLRAVTPELESKARGPAVDVEIRQYLRVLWQEVRELRGAQRAALLMNLRDVHGANGAALLLMSGVASFDEIAGAMGLEPEKLSEIWNDLPFDDNTIARSLDISRQQVINLRKAARERLLRRMAAFEGRKP